MGKKSKAPSYSTGNVTINGKNIATVTKNKNGEIQSTYNMSKSEKDMYNSIQNSLNNSLANLFTITDADKTSWNQQLETYKKNGIQQINDIYTPMETSLRNNIAGRFGNLDNSVFMDNLKNITDNKAQAVSSLSDSLVMKENELYANEISNRMNYISLLSGLSNDMNNQIMSYLNLAKSNAESGNNYNTKTYQSSGSGNFLSGAASFASATKGFFI